MLKCIRSYSISVLIILVITTTGARLPDRTSIINLNCPHPDYDALMVLYNQTNGAAWDDNTGWAEGQIGENCDPCTWYGIGCDNNGRVISLILDNNALAGTIPDLNLPFLSQLELGFNQLEGEIPDFSGLPALQRFRAMDNQLTGSLPDFSNMPLLEILHCANNELSGTIPDFTSLPNLRELILMGNMLVGTIPDFTDLPNLEWLEIGQNQLEGEIPDFSATPQVYRFRCMNNFLTGNIPDFTNLPLLEIFHCADNSLSGMIPAFSNTPVLRELTVAGNELTGPIPDLAYLPELDVFYCNNNNLSCFFPAFICGLDVFSSINNPMMPWQGAHANFCAGIDEVGAPCDDGNPLSEGDAIQESCDCMGEIPCSLSISFDSTGISCNSAADGELSLLIFDGAAPFTIDWNIDDYDGMSTLESLPSGNYSVVVTDTLGCSAEAAIALTEPALLTLSCSELAPVSTVGGTDGIASLTIDGGIPPYELSYAGPVSGVMAIDTGNYALDGLSEGNYIFQLTDANGCTADCSTEISGPSCALEVLLIATAPSCFNSNDGIINLEITGGVAPYAIDWNVDTFDGQETLSGLQSGSYQVVVADAENCTAAGEVMISAPSELQFSVTAIHPVCLGDSSGEVIIDSVFGGVPPYSMDFNGSTYNVGNTFPYILSGQNAGSYTAIITDSNGCQMSSGLTLEEGEALIVNLGADLSIQAGDSVLLDPEATSTLDSVIWSPSAGLSAPNSPSTFAIPAETTTYVLTAFSDNGCSGTDLITITVEPIDGKVFVPNAFSPNDDGVNDRLIVYAGEDVINVEDFQVFDRWGNQLYQQQDFPPNSSLHGWDGTFRGERMHTGVYLYFVQCRLSDDRLQLLKGDVTLIRP